MRLTRITDQRGDTIIEVLISVAIISLVLASSYAITNRNSGNNQDTQEHGQAQQIVQQQVELLRAAGQSNNLSSFKPGGCITGSVFSDDTAVCKFKGDGYTGCTEEPCYQVAITVDANKIYTVGVSWNNVRGNVSKLTMEYGI